MIIFWRTEDAGGGAFSVHSWSRGSWTSQIHTRTHTDTQSQGHTCVNRVSHSSVSPAEALIPLTVMLHSSQCAGRIWLELGIVHTVNHYWHWYHDSHKHDSYTLWLEKQIRKDCTTEQMTGKWMTAFDTYGSEMHRDSSVTFHTDTVGGKWKEISRHHKVSVFFLPLTLIRAIV